MQYITEIKRPWPLWYAPFLPLFLLQTGTVRQGWIQGIYDIVVAIEKKQHNGRRKSGAIKNLRRFYRNISASLDKFQFFFCSYEAC
jgi:hypothetical protein